MEERDPEGAHVLGEIRVIGDDHGDVHGQLTPPMPPQQVKKAVVGLGGEDRHSLAARSVVERPLHAEPVRKPLLDRLLQLRAHRSEAGETEDCPLEEASPRGQLSTGPR